MWFYLLVLPGFQTPEELAVKRIAASAAAKAAADAPAKCPFAAFGGPNPHATPSAGAGAGAVEGGSGSVGADVKGAGVGAGVGAGLKCPVNPYTWAAMLGITDHNVLIIAAALVAAYLAVQYADVFAEV